MSTFILSPHFDDAAVNCYSILNDKAISIVTVFGGIPPAGSVSLWDTVCGTANSRSIMQQRISENQQAFSGFKVKLTDLDFLDNQYRKTDLNALGIADRLRHLIPENSTVYAPLALSRQFRHPDHVLVRDAAMKLRHNRRLIFYPDMPYMRPAAKPDIAVNKIASLAFDSLGIRLKPKIIRLTPEDITLKTKLIKSYATQYLMTNLVSLGGLGRASRIGYELFFSLD